MTLDFTAGTLTFDYPADPIQERFELFHERHPEVYKQLVELARRAVQSGRTKVGIGMLFEVLRWERLIAGLPDEREHGLKLNNSYRSRYARLIMACNVDLADIFETRKMPTP